MTLEDAVAWYRAGGVTVDEFIDVVNNIVAEESKEKCNAIDKRRESSQ